MRLVSSTGTVGGGSITSWRFPPELNYEYKTGTTKPTCSDRKAVSGTLKQQKRRSTRVANPRNLRRPKHEDLLVEADDSENHIVNQFE